MIDNRFNRASKEAIDVGESSGKKSIRFYEIFNVPELGFD